MDGAGRVIGMGMSLRSSGGISCTPPLCADVSGFPAAVLIHSRCNRKTPRLGMSMKQSTIVIALTSVLILGGCATAQLDDLVDVSDQRGMLIAEPISFFLGDSAVMMAGVQAGLLPGYYPATKENANGTFYLGVGQCVWYKGKDQLSLVTGGIWLPKSSVNSARLFSVVGSASATGKSLDDAMSYCKQPSPSDEKTGLTSPDLQAVLLATPQALGIAPAGPNATLSTTQALGGVIGLAIVQAIADSAKGEYQILQKVEDPDALKKFEGGVLLVNRLRTEKR